MKSVNTVQSVNADVFLSCALLRLDQPGGSVDANDQTSGNLWIQSSGMAGLLHAEDPLDPGDNFVRARISRFVEIENAAFDVFGEGALKGR